MFGPLSLRLGTAVIPYTACARNLGFRISDNTNLDENKIISTSTIYRSAYVETRRISSIRQYPIIEASNVLACAHVLSKLNYCNSEIIP